MAQFFLFFREQHIYLKIQNNKLTNKYLKPNAKVQIHMNKVQIHKFKDQKLNLAKKKNPEKFLRLTFFVSYFKQ